MAAVGRRTVPDRRYPRTARVNELVREVVAEELERIADERLELVTVTGVDVEPDLRRATVWFTSLTDGVDDVLAEHRVHLQAAIGRQVRMKRTPELVFRRDPAIAGGRRVEDILRKLQDTGRDGTQEA
jgi:ribosome-binding factor A